MTITERAKHLDEIRNALEQGPDTPHKEDLLEALLDVRYDACCLHNLRRLVGSDPVK